MLVVRASTNIVISLTMMYNHVRYVIWLTYVLYFVNLNYKIFHEVSCVFDEKKLFNKE